MIGPPIVAVKLSALFLGISSDEGLGLSRFRCLWLQRRRRWTVRHLCDNTRETRL